MTLREKVAEALATYDSTVEPCPVSKGQVAFKAVCPKCGARSDQNCGLDATASFHFVKAVRTAIEQLGER